MDNDNSYSTEDMRILRSMGVALDPLPKPVLCYDHQIAHALLMERYAAQHQNLKATDAVAAERGEEIERLMGMVRLRDFVFGLVTGFLSAAGFLVLALILTGRLKPWT